MNDTNLNVEKNQVNKQRVYLFSFALVVLLIIGTVNYGLHILLLTAVSFAVSLLVEFAFAKMRKKPFDPEWMITPMLVVLILPPGVPAWLVGIATFFAVFFGKNIFGGSGKYIFSPALVGALFVLISFPVQMSTTWLNQGGDLFTGATPLLSLFRGTDPYPFTTMQLLLGEAPGVVGETFRLGVLVLGAMLLILKVRDWKVPASYLGFFFVLTGLSYLFFDWGRDPILSLLTGGILFGAIFIASDPVLAPENTKGKILYGLGLALLTFIIRFFGTYAEGVTFAIIIMSAISPLIDSVTVKKTEEVASV
jgi:Na+-transporting NADH:ubiquinone oxidoreductase subunit B/electron transport complex protein RnfD